MERKELLRTLAFADAGLWGGIIFPEKLPAIAADLLVRGVDSPTLRNLAGADLEPVDPRDIRDLYQQLIDEAEAPTLELHDRVVMASQLLAAAVETGRLTVLESLVWFERLAIIARYPDIGDLMAMYSLKDELDGSWGRTAQDIEREASNTARRIAARSDVIPAAVVATVTAR